ncbi:MAG: DUF72 domain-containing protein [Polaromonas sp.]|nr:DUF72 domain-containing protein [Polaromonas sp.]
MSSPASTTVSIGCAGWSLPREVWPQFPGDGSHLERYAQQLNAAEINSSFYRPHQHATYARWADSVPADFRFAVKLPKTISHEQRLHKPGALLETFLSQATGLGSKLGCLLLQLPPSLVFDDATAIAFFKALRAQHKGAVALEPRHASWFNADAHALLQTWKIARVLADPVLHEAGVAPGGWPGLVYVRLHGSPRMYYSSYDADTLQALALKLREVAEAGAEPWCIFDNTASGAATANAMALNALLRKR